MMPDRRDVLTWTLGWLTAQGLPVASPSAGRPAGAPPPALGNPSARGLPVARIFQLDREARAQFRYQQPAQYPVRDFSADVAAGRPWSGNCTNLAVTAVALMKRGGAPQGSLYLALVLDFEHHGQHAVGVVQDETGGRWVPSRPCATA
jgi:hypothetical protein